MPCPQAGSRGPLSLEYLNVLAGMWEEALGHKLLPPFPSSFWELTLVSPAY